jgi:hypothetical protein
MRDENLRRKDTPSNSLVCEIQVMKNPLVGSTSGFGEFQVQSNQSSQPPGREELAVREMVAWVRRIEIDVA